MNDKLYSRIFNKKRQTIGMVAAVKSETDNSVRIGWSLTHPKDRTKNLSKDWKELALSIAVTRAKFGGKPIPPSIAADVNYMYNRALRYFKNHTVIMP